MTMVKNEQSRISHQSTITIPTTPIPPAIPAPSSSSMFSTTESTGVSSQRLIDPNAIDITSLKGQFAWEKMPLCDTYMPVIFRGDTKYFCIRMLRKILPDYPEDVIRRSCQFHYRKAIDVYSVTACEVELLNRINSHHARWTFSRQPFTALDEIVRVSDFLPFYEYLRHGSKSISNLSSAAAINTLRQLLPQPQHIVQRSSPDNISNMPSIISRQPTIPQATPVQIQSYSSSINLARGIISSTSRPVTPTSNVRPTKSVPNPYAVLLPTRLSQQPPSQMRPSAPSLLNSTTNLSPTVPSNNTPTALTIPAVSAISSTDRCSPSIVPPLTNHSPPASTSPVVPSSTTTLNRKPSTSSVSPSSSTTSSSKSSRLHCGWLQVNKLYTPYISSSATDHHLYKLPVSLLTFYDLIKNPTNDTNDSSNESLPPFEQTTGTAQEIELINELCIKQHIKPFGVDTKLIQLSTFYQYSSANILFVKELPNEEPKTSICKDWASIVQINGGICRIRNVTTLYEQTVPFIGNKILKNFILSSHCLSTASLTKPTASELEFLQLILFFSNISINLRNTQLIDIDSVRKEYNVDLILLFNDKFPLNVLNYQQQGNRSNAPQGSIVPANPTAPTNTIAESTPPPSPPFPPSPSTTQPQTASTSQLPLTSSTNRYYKTIEFHGHSLTAYVCSGLGSTTQRECVSIKSLCNILYPNSTAVDKLEVKMLRLLRSKNVNRFRPQNQQSLGFTRLIDIKDAEKHWSDIEQEIRAIINDNEEASIRSSVSSVSTENSKASTVVERVEIDEQPAAVEASVEPNKGEKRPLDEPLDDEDIPVMERINKRVRFAEKENNKQLTETLKKSKQTLSNGKAKIDDEIADKTATKRTIKLSLVIGNKKRLLPSTRTNRQSPATWVKKYAIEDCCIQINSRDPMFDIARD